MRDIKPIRRDDRVKGNLSWASRTSRARARPESSNTQEVTAIDRGILELKSAIADLSTQIDHITEKINSCKTKPMAAVRQQHKSLLRSQTCKSSTATLRALLADPSLRRDAVERTFDVLADASADTRELDERYRKPKHLLRSAVWCIRKISGVDLFWTSLCDITPKGGAGLVLSYQLTGAAGLTPGPRPTRWSMLRADSERLRAGSELRRDQNPSPFHAN
ncbi:hypothetical protein BGY98DRAFT_1171678 [Russula aff. rugulosa BPL654]|nr:hypothetical protein BGY98DRAFT_1171678 [Russula aff. rugulosa BPL654]